jgi:hypothetical protein
MNRDDLRRDLEDYEVTIADGFDDAIIGIGERCGQPMLAVYDIDLIIETLMGRDGLTYEEAWEHFSFNIGGAWVGPETPIYVHMVKED